MGRIVLNGKKYMGGGGSGEIVELTLAEYEALPDTKLTDGVAYFIKDLNASNVQGYPPLIYSDVEREIGVWRDGKPLYQKTFHTTTPSTAQTIAVIANTTDLNIDEVVVLFGSVTNSSNCPVNWYLDDSNRTACFVNLAKTGIAMWIENSAIASTPCNVTIQYTKTIDTAGSGIWNGQGGIAHHYSTTETVVGTWLGKPLYERVIEGDLNGAYSGTYTINYSDISANIKELISYTGRIRYNYQMAGTDLSWYGFNYVNSAGSISVLLANQEKVGGSPANKLNIVLANQNWALMDLYKIVVQYTKTTD